MHALSSRYQLEGFDESMNNIYTVLKTVVSVDNTNCSQFVLSVHGEIKSISCISNIVGDIAGDIAAFLLKGMMMAHVAFPKHSGLHL